MKDKMEYRKYQCLEEGEVSEKELRSWVRSLQKLIWKDQVERRVQTKPRQLVLKSPCHTGWVMLLLKLYPRAKFLFVQFIGISMKPFYQVRSEKEAEPASFGKDRAPSESVSKRRSSRDESSDHRSEREPRANSRSTKSESRFNSITPKRADKVRFQDEPTIASAKDLDKAMSLSMESSSKKRPHSIIAKSKSRDGAKTQKLDIFSQGDDASSSKKSLPSKGRPGSSSARSGSSSNDRRRSGSSSKDRRSSQDSAIAAGKKTSSSKDLPLPLPSSRRSESSSKDRDGASASTKKSSSSKDRPSSSRRSESSSSSKDRDSAIAGTKEPSSSKDRPSSSRRSESSQVSNHRSSRKRTPLSQSTANTVNSRRRKTSASSGVNKKPRTGMSSQGGDFSFLD